MKHLHLLSYLYIFLCLNLAAADLVTTQTQDQDEIKDDVIISVNSGAKSFRPYTIVPSGGNGSTSEQPFVTYVAYQNAVKSTVWRQFTLGDGLSSSNGPLFIGSSSPGTQSITMPLEIDADGRRSLFIAVKDTSISDGSEWVVIALENQVTTASQNDLELTFAFDPNLICTTYLISQCSSIISGSTDRQVLNLFFFLADNGDSDSNFSLGSTIDPADYSGKGLYWDLSISSRLPSFTSGSITIDSARRGDKRILLDYTLPNSINDFKEIVVIYQAQNSDPTPASTLLFADIAGALSSESVSFDDYGKNLNGTVNVKNLINNETFDAYLGVVDNYYLSPKFSDKATGSTAAIEELLKEQSCFFLTAGFGEDHPVIRGFRKFRDRVLLKKVLGKIFVTTYYKIAPNWAPWIYQHDGFRFMIRLWSTSIFFIATNLVGFMAVSISFLIGLATYRKFKFRLSFF